MKFQENLSRLKERTFSPEHNILTVYLNTEPERKQQTSWKLHLKNGMNRLTEYAKAEGSKEQEKQLSKLHKLLESTIENHRGDLKRGIVLVVCPEEGVLFLEKLQVPAPNAFYWQSQPELTELEALFNQYPAAGIVLVGSDSVTVVDTMLGEVEREWNYEWDSDSEDWKQYQGVAATSRTASSASHKELFDKRVGANRQRWLKRLSPILERHKKRNSWQEIVLAGESLLTSELAKELNGNKPRILSKNLNGMTTNQVLQEVYT
ncbi:VLRF1 family aeRF1-type release factor [Paenibacillus sp. 1P07SE]|uniref:VLRF1 family aeRF1-type release factor n=1 Tax=Paenibacillus sp. 1P07SE TaxID=3132209 RepID=UPI0039A7286D